MVTKKFGLVLALLAVSMIAFMGCSEDNDNPINSGNMEQP